MENTRFCKLCGSQLDDNQICIGCGKRYFSLKNCIKKINMFKIVSVIIICATISTSILFYYMYRDARTKNERIQTIVTGLRTAEAADFNKIKKLETSLKWYYSNIAITTEEGKKYHTIDCQYVKNKAFYAGTVKQAVAAGYTPCSACHK